MKEQDRGVRDIEWAGSTC